MKAKIKLGAVILVNGRFDNWAASRDIDLNKKHMRLVFDVVEYWDRRRCILVRDGYGRPDACGFDWGCVRVFNEGIHLLTDDEQLIPLTKKAKAKDV